jgi:hypothetical protein
MYKVMETLSTTCNLLLKLTEEENPTYLSFKVSTSQRTEIYPEWSRGKHPHPLSIHDAL